MVGNFVIMVLAIGLGLITGKVFSHETIQMMIMILLIMFILTHK